MYDKGTNVPKDSVLSYMWFNLAAAQGDEYSAERRDLIAEKMTSADISKAQELTRKWMEDFESRNSN